MATIDQVVAEDCCSGCGGCASLGGSRTWIELTPQGMLKANVVDALEDERAMASRVCPFADESANEEQLATKFFPSLPQHPLLGRYRRVLAGRVADDDYVLGSSSGGLTSWLAEELLQLGLVDGVIHVGHGGARTDQGALFGYTVSRRASDIRGKRKSNYYPASFETCVEQIRGDGKRYAFIGIPCAVHSLRLVCEQDESLRQQICFFIGLICGHLKSQNFARSLAWQVGVPPADVATVDFRLKNQGKPAMSYDFGVLAHGDERPRRELTSELVGGSWGHALFQPNACNYCEDVFAEAADIVFGDAWLPQYEQDWRGTNVVVTRNAVLDEILERGSKRGRLAIESISENDAAESQAGNFRHRRMGLSVRLADDDAAGTWRPKKRTGAASYPVSRKRRALIRQRRLLSAVSHSIFARAQIESDLSVYLREISLHIRRYREIDQPSYLRQVVRRARRTAKSLLRHS